MSCQYGFHFLYSGSPQYIRVFHHIYSNLKPSRKPPFRARRISPGVNIPFLEELPPWIFRIWAMTHPQDCASWVSCCDLPQPEIPTLGSLSAIAKFPFPMPSLPDFGLLHRESGVPSWQRVQSVVFPEPCSFFLATTRNAARACGPSRRGFCAKRPRDTKEVMKRGVKREELEICFTFWVRFH
jgi:hypothetical protein